jgi:hypothetical protein
MFTPLEPVTLCGLDFDFRNAGAQSSPTYPPDHVAAFADFYFSVAFAVPIKLNARFPSADALAVYKGIRGYVKVLNGDAVAAAASVTPPIIALRRSRIRRRSHEKSAEQARKQYPFEPIHKISSARDFDY